MAADEFMRIGGRSVNGLAKAIRTDDEGNLRLAGSNTDGSVNSEVLFKSDVKIKADYAGKVRGDLSVPHIARSTASTSILPIPATSLTEVTQQHYDRIFANDSDNASVTSSQAGNYAQFVFTIDLLQSGKRQEVLPAYADTNELIRRLKILTPSVYAWGRGNNGGVYSNGITVKIWNYRTSAWDAWGSNTASQASLIINHVTNFNDYISTAGAMSLGVHATYPALDSSVWTYAYVNYIKVDMQLAGAVTADQLTFKVKDDEGYGVDLSTVKDPQGRAVLRVLDAAPHGYDVANDWINVNSNILNANVLKMIELQEKSLILQEMQTGTNYLYKEGFEREGWQDGLVTATDGLITKETDHIMLQAGLTNEAISQACLESSLLMDLTHVNRLVIDWENTGDTSDYNQSYFDISQLSGANVWSNLKNVALIRPFARQESMLDVRDFKGMYFIRVSARNAASTAKIKSEIKVYSIRKEY